MSLENLVESINTLSHISFLGFGFAIFGGLIVAFSPSAFPLIPVVMSYVAGSEKTYKRKAFILSLAFILGIAFINAVLGALFSAGGAAAGKLFGPKWNLIVVLTLLVIGLRVLGVVRFKVPMPHLKGREVSGIISAFLFGIPFAFSLCPYCVPIQLALLTVAASIGNIWYGTALLFIFGLARGAPLLLAGMFTGALKSLKPFVGYVSYFEKIAGMAFLILAAYYFYQFWQYLKAIVF